MAKEKMKEWVITAKFHFDATLTVEAESEKEARKHASTFMQKHCRDLISDKDNILLKIEEQHVISPEERSVLEADGVIEPVKKVKSPKTKNKKK